jgi:hypothetical protein
VPEEHREAISGSNVQFTCVSCHFKVGVAASPYFVRVFSFLMPMVLMPMDVILCSQGFTSGGQPVLPLFLNVKGHFEMETIGQVLCPTTLLLDLCFVDIGIKAHVAIVYAALQDYFPTGRFYLISIPFDLGTDIAVADWPTVVDHRLKTISSSYQQVVIVVTNHTDEDTGDMFLGADEMGKGHATEVDQVCFV